MRACIFPLSPLPVVKILVDRVCMIIQLVFFGSRFLFRFVLIMASLVIMSSVIEFLTYSNQDSFKSKLT